MLGLHNDPDPSFFMRHGVNPEVNLQTFQASPQSHHQNDCKADVIEFEDKLLIAIEIGKVVIHGQSWAIFHFLMSTL